MSNKEQRKAPVLRFKGFTDDWEQRKLKDTANFAKGIGYSKKDLKSSGIPIILYGRLYTKYETVINEIDTFTQPKKDTFLSKGGEIIVPASGETAEDISVASVVKNKGIILGGDLNIVYPNSSLNSVFLALNITYGRAHDEMRRRAQGKTIVHLHNSDLANIKLKIPTISEQKKIVYLLEKINKLIALQQRKLDRLKEIRKSYLSKIFPNKRENRPSLKFNNLKNTSWKPHKLKDIVTNVETGKSKVKLQPKGKYPVLGSTSIIGYNDHYDYSGDFILIARVGAYAGKMYRFSGSVKITDNTVFIQSAYNTFLYYYLRNFNLKKLSFGSGQPLVKSSELKSLSILIPSSKEEIKAISRLSIIFDNLINVQEKKVSSIRQIKKFLLQNMFT